MALALLVVSLAALAWYQRNDVRTFRRFRAIEDSERRQRIFLRWAVRNCALFLGVPLAGLALLGRIDILWNFPAEFDGVAAAMPWFGAFDTSFVAGMAGALLGGAALGALIAARRRKPAKAPPGLDITPMLPRNGAELLRVAPLAINAGISEEIFFRLYLPLLMVLAGANAWISFAAAALIFGGLHRYQGWLGVFVTTLLGTVFTLLYLGSLGLALPILVHLLLNLNALVIRPAVRLRFPPRSD